MAGDIATAPHGQAALQPLGEVNFENGYAGLVAAFRARAAEQKIAIGGDSVAAVSGLPVAYVAKLLQPRPAKRLGAISLGPLLGVLGLRLLVCADPIALARFGSKLEKRREAFVHSEAVHQVVFSRRFLKKIGALGGKNSRANMTAQQARRLARKAAAARWSKRKRQNGHSAASPAGEIVS
jgi:hypothetical protein